MKARLVAAVLLVLAVPTASAESMKHLSKRVFELARVQYTQLDDQLGPAEFPRSLHPDGSLWKSKQNWWCSGFWPGMLWYTFAGTNDPDMAARADRNTHKLDGLIETPTHHDIGFQLNSSFGNAAQIAGIAPGPILRDGALKLAGRFNPKVGAIKSWESGKRGRYPVIIDNMMNLELLMRAARYFQLDTLRFIAITHARNTLRTHFRDDFTTFHLVDFDPQTGAVTARKTVQGYSDESVWARGEAWALYGYAMMARECAKSGLTAESREFLAQATGIGKWVAAHLPADGIPYWDFSDPAIPDTWRDASAAAILASGFLDLARQLESSDAALAKRFRKLAKRQLKTLASAPYLAKAGQNGGFLLRHCVGNLPAGSEIDVPLTYADYYFLEALLRWQEK